MTTYDIITCNGTPYAVMATVNGQPVCVAIPHPKRVIALINGSRYHEFYDHNCLAAAKVVKELKRVAKTTRPSVLIELYLQALRDYKVAPEFPVYVVLTDGAVVDTAIDFVLNNCAAARLAIPGLKDLNDCTNLRPLEAGVVRMFKSHPDYVVELHSVTILNYLGFPQNDKCIVLGFSDLGYVGLGVHKTNVERYTAGLKLAIDYIL